MKKLYLTTLMSIGAATGAMADGTVNFSNFPLPGYVTFGFPSPSISAPTNTAPVGSYEVELLFASGSSTSQPQSAFTLIDTFTSKAGSGNGPGYFFAGTVTVPGSLYGNGSGGSGVFEIEGFGLGAYQFDCGTSGEFVNTMGSNTAIPPTPPSILSGWNGSLALVVDDPEPSTMAISGLGAAALFLYRRKKKV